MITEDKILLQESVSNIQTILAKNKTNNKYSQKTYDMDIDNLVLDLLYGFSTDIESELLEFIDDDKINEYATDYCNVIDIDDVEQYAEDNFDMVKSNSFNEKISEIEISTLADQLKLDIIVKMHEQIPLYSLMELEKSLNL